MDGAGSRGLVGSGAGDLLKYRIHRILLRIGLSVGVLAFSGAMD